VPVTIPEEVLTAAFTNADAAGMAKMKYLENQISVARHALMVSQQALTNASMSYESLCSQLLSAKRALTTTNAAITHL